MSLIERDKLKFQPYISENMNRLIETVSVPSRGDYKVLRSKYKVLRNATIAVVGCGGRFPLWSQHALHMHCVIATIDL